jgi:peptide/nickel transport system substrate-binding protein
MSGMLTRRELLAAVAAAGVGAAIDLGPLAGVAGASSSVLESEQATDSLTVGLRAILTSLTPFAVQGYQWSNMIGYALYDPLVKISATGELIPQIAASWDTSSPTETIIHVRPNVKFQNGSPVTAADVAYSIAARSDPKLIAQTNGRAAMTPKQWVSADAVGPLTVRIRTTSRTQILTQPQPILVVPNNAFKTTKVNANAVGSGPYSVKQFVSGASLSMTANPDYWGGVPPITNLTFQLFSDVAAVVLNLRSGQIDAVYDIDPLYIAQFKKVSAGRQLIREATYADWWIVQFGQPPLNNLAVRKALRYCFNMDLINKSVFDGLGQHPWDPFQFFPPAYHGRPTIDWTYDPEKAKFLLKQAGASNISVPLLGIDTYQDSIDEGQIIEQGLRAAGVQSTFATQPLAQWIDTLYTKGSWQGLAFNAGQLPVPFSNFWSYLVDPSSVLSSYTKGSPYPAVNNSLNAVNSALPAREPALMRQAEDLIINEVAAYCMFGAPVYTMIPGNLHGVETNGIGDVRWNKAAFS